RPSGSSRWSTSSSGSPSSTCSSASSARRRSSRPLRAPVRRPIMPTERMLALVMMTALSLYVLMGGADFGGGVWDLLASGPRRDQQRALIEKALGPIWEANHVWLILVVVLLFAAFPPAFSAITIALHAPLTLFLVGVVFRGSAFTFRTYDSRG